LCTSTAGPLLAGWGLLNNHSVRAGAEASSVAAIDQPLGSFADRGSDKLRYCHRLGRDRHAVRIGFAQRVDHVRYFGFLWRAVDVHDLPECRRLWWRRFCVKVGEVELDQVGRDVFEATVGIVVPQRVPIVWRELFFLTL